MSLSSFHPLIQQWFQSRFSTPTPPQEQGWPYILSGDHTLIAAPTGSGKTLTAFLVAIDRLLQQATRGELTDEIRVIYVSPLRALSNDMHRNLEVPLAEILALAEAAGLELPPIRAGLRTGDTSAAARAAIVRRPPHILVTTPESLYLMLTSSKARERLRQVETVIVDEIHALVRDKRGSHLALTMERLAALCPHPIQRIGLSATQRPIETIGQFLVGSTTPLPRIIDVGHQRDLDLAIEIPPSELGAVCMHEQWAEINARICELVNSHRSTLIFVNTRRMAERVTHQLTELLGEDAVSSHHGSLAAELRLGTEQRLKSGALKAVVATASLELGLDVGYIDLVIQIGSPRSIATLLQRVGRSGHALGLVPKGRLFALTRDELVEALALLRAIRCGRLDTIPIPESPLDILAQQIVAEVACEEWGTDDLFDLCRRAYPFRNLARESFDQVVQFLSEGLTAASGRGKVYLHHDQVGRRLRSRPGSRIAAVTSGGAIPEIASYRVVAEPERTVVGTVDEEFATESQAGEIFLLGNTSWRIQYVRGGDVVVTDAAGAPPSIPFWRGEAPGRTVELSEEVSRLRADLESRLDDPAAAEAWLVAETATSPTVAAQVITYATAQQAAIGLLPTQQRVVFERFFDESGGMQLVIHAPFGSRITHAWGLALRKRFCRSFDFELQASADDDGIVLSLGPQHSFPLESMFGMLNPRNIQALLEQALLAVPTFQTRWRWNVTRALLVLRFKNGKKVPPALQRFRADDLLTSVFPKLTGCQENVVGDIELPDHPLVRQSMHDSLTEAHDIDGLLRVMEAVERGEITYIARDTREPSPFSYELLNANPYAFLDGGEAAERRARAVATRRSLNVESVDDLGRLDPEAIAQVRQEAQPLVRSADELHDVLLSRCLLPMDETAGWEGLFSELAGQRRAAVITCENLPAAWVAAERLPLVRACFPTAVCEPELVPPEGVRQDWTAEEARVTMIRGLLEVCGPITADEVAAKFGLSQSQVESSLEALEGEGIVLRGRFTPSAGKSWEPETEPESAEETAAAAGQEQEPAQEQSHDQTQQQNRIVEWCHRRLLSRIHRLTMEGLRKQIEPVTADVYLRFLTRHHGLLPDFRRSGTNGLFEVIGMLQGLDFPAVTWERDLLPIRLDRYRPEWLDELCLTGEVGWGRLFPPQRSLERARPMAALTRVVPMSLFLRADLPWLQTNSTPGEVDTLSSPARQLIEHLQRVGALFAADLLHDLRLLPSQVNEVLGELVTAGRVTSDGFAGLRMLLHERNRDSERRQMRARQRGTRRRLPLSGSGRWSLWRRAEDGDVSATSNGQPLVSSGAPAGHTAIDSMNNGAAASDPMVNAPAPTVRSTSPSPSEIRLAAAVERREVVEQWAWQLLRRWGVMFRDLLEREDGAPRWFELLQVYRRLEARGEIRGGRFIAGVAGEQFALGDSVKLLRRLREEGPQQELVVISAVDPLNLVGVLSSQSRVPRTASNKVVLLDGVAVAAVFSGEVQFLGEPGDKVRRRIQQALSTREPPLETQPAEIESAEMKPAESATGAGPADESSAAVNQSVETKPQRQTSLFSRRR